MSSVVRLRLGFAPLFLAMLESTGRAVAAGWVDAVARAYRVMQMPMSAKIRAIATCVSIRACLSR